MNKTTKKNKREQVFLSVDKEVVDIYRSLAKAKNDFNKTEAFTLPIMLREALMRDSKKQAEVLRKGIEKISSRNNFSEEIQPDSQQAMDEFLKSKE